MKKIMKLGVIGVVLLFIIIMISSFFTSVDMSWQNIEAGYYRQIVMLPNGKFIGICKVNDSEAKNAGVSLKVEKEDGTLKRITAVNDGNLDYGCIFVLKPSTDFFFTSMDSIVFQELTVNVNGKDLEYSWKIDNNDKVSYKYILVNGATGLAETVLNKHGDSLWEKYILTYKDDKITNVQIYNANEKKTGEYIWEYNNTSLPSSISVKRENGDISMRHEYKYDSNNRIVENRYYEIFYSNGLQPYQPDRSAIIISKYSSHIIPPNNRFDALCWAAIVRYTYADNNPYPITIETLDKDEKPLDTIREKFYKVALKYDDKCRIIQVNAYHSDGTPAPIPESEKYIGGKDAKYSNPPTYEIRIEYNGNTFNQQNIGKEVNTNNATPTKQNDKLSLGGVALTNAVTDLSSLLGTPITTENKNGITVQKYKDVEVHISNSQIQMIVSNSPNAQTSRGIHEQSSIHDAVKTYGGAYETSEYGNYDLIEYKVNDAKIGECIIRFAVEKNNNKVNYISIRRAG